VSGGLFAENNLSQDQSVKVAGKILLDAPFIPQAPYAEWDDPRQQEGCEEASVLIAYKWLTGKKIITQAEARKEILNMTTYQYNKYRVYSDTSVDDTAKRLLRGYYGYKNWEVKNVSTKAKLVDEIMKKNLLIVPVNGQKLKNPFFKGAGPLRHMLVVIGYDPDTKEVITHDPGTVRGNGYRYPLAGFFNAIRDYETGRYAPIKKENKSLIIVYPLKK
jgi:Peptidase_C39 like family